MSQTTVDFTGDIFDINSFNFQPAFDATLAFGVDAIGERTPVITGDLKRGLDSDDSSIFDDVFYSGYVEAGTVKMSARSMMENSLDEISEEFLDQLIGILP